MTILKALIKKEIIGYFKNYTAYIISGVYLLLSFAAMFYVAHFFEYNNHGLISYFAYQPEILNVLLPALTMKMWAEERKQGTLEFLLTQPVNYRTLVLGKYVAALLSGTFLLVLTLPFLGISSLWINFDWLNITSAYLGCFWVIAVLCALGCLISACYTNTILAYLSAVFLGWLWENANLDIILNPVRDMFPLLQNRMQSLLNFSQNYNSFILGQVTLESVVYFISITIICLWLNLILVYRRR